MRSRADQYDWELAHVAGRFQQDLARYQDLAERTGGPVLELACGTGRLTGPLGAVGLDMDHAMLAAARRRGVRHLVRADMRSFHLARRFGLVAIPYNSLQLLVDDDDVLSCLRCAAAHLLPGGVVAFEVTDFQLGARRASVGLEVLARAEGATLHGALVHDFSRRVSTYHRRFEEGGRARVDHVSLRCFRAAELEALLARAGLDLVDVAEEGPRRFSVARHLASAPAPRPAPSRRSTALASRARARLA